MAITKIKDSDYSNKGIRVKNNPLGLSVSEAQRAFDELSLDVIIPAVNRMAGEIDTTVSELQNKDTTNSTAIAKNTADISTNKSDISKNKTDISQNKTDITELKERVSTTETDISTNKIFLLSYTFLYPFLLSQKQFS
jgi:chromosome segregation ATPase